MSVFPLLKHHQQLRCTQIFHPRCWISSRMFYVVRFAFCSGLWINPDHRGTFKFPCKIQVCIKILIFYLFRFGVVVGLSNVYIFWKILSICLTASSQMFFEPSGRLLQLLTGYLCRYRADHIYLHEFEYLNLPRRRSETGYWKVRLIISDQSLWSHQNHWSPPIHQSRQCQDQKPCPLY